MLDLANLSSAVRYEGGISRRLLLAYGAALAALPGLALQGLAEDRTIKVKGNPFSLGVASGDPHESGVVLWTKLAPKPLEPGGGMPAENIAVNWEISEDEGLKKIVASGTVPALAQFGHSVHVEVDGLKADRWYWYRFITGDAVSPVGRTRTMPAAAALPGKLKFAFASCQHFEAGLYTAYDAMAKDDVDLVFHLGDYIYEGAPRENALRTHSGPKTGKVKSLADYRERYAQYRADPLLHGMHALCPWFVTWDDHEVENNYAGAIPGGLKPGDPKPDPAVFLAKRAAAYQAYYEMMPLRKRSLPQGPNLTLYRKAAFGRLAEFFVLDTRQYRTNQPNGDGLKPLNEAALSPANTLMGKTQREWLFSNLAASAGTWNVLAQQVMMALVNQGSRAKPEYSMDRWAGAAYERLAVTKYLADTKVANPVVLTGDIHSNWVNNLHVDDRRPETKVVATEFVGTSITSGGNEADKPGGYETLLSDNPFVKFHSRGRGYVRCTVTPKTWQSDYIGVDDITKPGSRVSTRASFVVEAGKPGAKKA